MSSRITKLTSFEWKVLNAAAKIPIGQTRSYKWVAKTIGHPKAARAVGRALGKNPFLIIIPCHRVIKEDGSLGGYAGGLSKKAALIKLEKDIARRLRQQK